MSRCREYNFRICCEWCGATFEASRYDAKFCSGECRSKSYRHELKRSRKLERIKRDIDDLLSGCRMEIADILARDIASCALAHEIKTIGGER